MTDLQFPPFDSIELMDNMKKRLPEYNIQKSPFGNYFKVIKKGLTVTGVVQVKTRPKEGLIKTKIPFDNVLLTIIILIPLGLYILIKKSKQKELEQKVIDELTSILNK